MKSLSAIHNALPVHACFKQPFVVSEAPTQHFKKLILKIVKIMRHFDWPRNSTGLMPL